MYKVIILPLNKKDISKSFNWYEQQKKGLGVRFNTNLRNIIYFIQQNPTSFNIKYRDVRIGVMSVFPYLILYRIDEVNKPIIISAVLHSSQNPKHWEGR